MNNKKKAIIVVAAIIGLFVLNTAFRYAMGGSFRDSNFQPAQLILLRIVIMVGAIGVGFAIGWIFSPSAKPFRMLSVYVVGGLLVMQTLVNGGVVGWGATAIVASLGFLTAFGYWVGTGMSALAKAPTTFGSSRWATMQDVSDHNVLGPEGIKLGAVVMEGQSKVVSYLGDRHLLTVAPTRSGKGTTQIIPNLLSYEGSVVVIDPKGENALITAKQRHEMGQKVHIVDPWGIVNFDGVEPSRFNPLDWLVSGDLDITENAMLLADALVIGESHADSFWTEEAKALLQGIILYVATDEQEDGQRHLGRVRELLLLDGEQQQEFFRYMLKSTHHIVASTGARCLQKEPKLLANVLASAQAQTHFLDSARLQDSLSASDFRFDDLKEQPTTIYLVLPADRLNAFGRWLRLLIQQAITVNARNIDVKPEKPVLFILDEFAALGRLTMIEQAYGLMAGFGMQLWGIVQDLNQLERIYDKGWQSFIANAGMINSFGSSDKMAAEYFSSMCGETTVWNLSSALSSAFSRGTGGGNNSTSDTITNSDTRAAAQRKLIYPDELMRLDANKQLIFIENMYPLQAKRIAWFEDENLKHLGNNLLAKQQTQIAENDDLQATQVTQ